MLRIEWGKSDEEIIAILINNPSKRIWSVDEKGLFNSYDLEDLKWERENKEWNKVGSREYLISPPPGGFKEGTSGGGIAQEPGTFPYLTDKQASQDVSDRWGSYTVFVFPRSNPVSRDEVVHAVLRSHILGNPRVGRRGGMVVIESQGDYAEGGYTVSWLSGEDKVLHIGGRKCPDALVDAYLEKYPSSLPKDFEVDMYAWAQKELLRCLKEMKENVEEPDENLMYRPPNRFHNALSELGTYFEDWGICADWFRRRQALYEEHVAGKAWKQDYETYRKELFALRRESLKRVEEMVEKAKVGIRFETKGRRRFIVGEKPPGAWLRSPKVLVPLAVVGLGGTALLIRSRLRTAAHAPAPPRQTSEAP